jgi:hypothetical protein
MEHPDMDKAPLHAQPEADSDLEEEFVRQKRPFGVTLFLWMVLMLSAWGLLRFFAVLSWWSVLSQFGAHLSPWYLSITGAGWAVAGGVLFWSILSRKRWTYSAVPLSLAVWLVEYWIERIFFEASRANLLFAVLLSGFLLTVLLIVTKNRNTKNFITRIEEHEQPDTYSTSA